MIYPEYIKKCIDMLEDNGFSGYAVGGAVRDCLLGRAVHDWDVATSARPDETLRVFENFRTIPTGLKHGTVTVLFDNGEGKNVPVEITTFRIDGEYLDNRHPSEVIFTSRIADDLSRRDFTVNAMAFNEKEGLIDCFSGREDLKNKVIRCVGEPEKRYGEDALRILRAFRFAAQLGFEIEERTLAAAGSCAHLLKNIARERIGVEFLKLLESDGALYSLERMIDGGVFSALFDFVPVPERETLENIAKLGSRNAMTRLSALILPYSDGEKHAFVHSLRLSNEQKKLVLRLCGASEYELPQNNEDVERSARRFLSLYDNISDMALEVLGKLSPLDESLLEKFADAVRREKQKKRCLDIASLAVSGSDILPLCADEPSKVGKILSALLDDVIENPSHNERSYLLDMAGKLV